MTTEEDTTYLEIQAEAYCNHVRGLANREAAARMRKEETEARIDGIGAVRYDREGGRTYLAHGDDAMARAVASLNAARQRHEDAIVQCEAERKEFDAAISNITPLYASLLTYRYEMCMSWTQVADQPDISMTEDYVRGDLRRKALAELYPFLPPGWQ